MKAEEEVSILLILHPSSFILALAPFPAKWYKFPQEAIKFPKCLALCIARFNV